jgi:hypothetical protein
VKARKPSKKGLKGLGIFKSRLPEWKDVFTVLSVIVFAVFSWSIRGFLFILPSIALRYAAMEIVAIFFYMMAFALLESLLIAGSLAVVSAILPKMWLREGFSYKGFLIVLISSVASILYQASLRDELPGTNIYFLWVGVPILILIVLILLFHFVHRWRVVLQSVAERFMVFAYLYIPIGVLGLVAVIFRNLLNG